MATLDSVPNILHSIPQCMQPHWTYRTGARGGGGGGGGVQRWPADAIRSLPLTCTLVLEPLSQSVHQRDRKTSQGWDQSLLLSALEYTFCLSHIGNRSTLPAGAANYDRICTWHQHRVIPDLLYEKEVSHILLPGKQLRLWRGPHHHQQMILVSAHVIPQSNPQLV